MLGVFGMDLMTFTLATGAVLILIWYIGRFGIASYLSRSLGDWVLDLLNLIFQGLGIPVLQSVFIAAIWASMLPEWQGKFEFHGIVTFLFAFILVDYCYYWNHRILHRPKLWPIHLVHHTADRMDIIITSRNTLWSSFFILYLWVHGTLLFFLADPLPYLIGITFSSILDLWRHSGLEPDGRIKKLLGYFLILPNDHSWHHSQDVYGVNFGANFNLWDKIHGTWYGKDQIPQKFGVKTELSLVQKLMWPFE